MAPNYTGFFLTPWGRLQPIPHSTVICRPDRTPATSSSTMTARSSSAPSSAGRLRAAPSSTASAFIRNGTLTAASGPPFVAQGLGAFGSEFSPIHPDQVFVSNPHNGAGLGTVSAFQDSWNGTLSSIGDSPFADGQTAPCWLVVSHDGKYLYALNTGSGTISGYSIAPAGTLTLIGSTPLSTTATGKITGTDVTISNDDSTLYVNESNNGTVAAFSLNDGTATQQAGSPYATGFGAGSTTIGIADN